MRSSHSLDRIAATFDDGRLIAHAGLLLPARLAQHLGLGELVDDFVDLGGAAGRAHAGDKVLTLVALGAGIVTTRTLRRRFFSLPGRMTRSARRLTLHLPALWPWAAAFSAALLKLRTLSPPLPG